MKVDVSTCRQDRCIARCSAATELSTLSGSRFYKIDAPRPHTRPRPSLPLDHVRPSPHLDGVVSPSVRWRRSLGPWQIRREIDGSNYESRRQIATTDAIVDRQQRSPHQFHRACSPDRVTDRRSPDVQVAIVQR